MRNLCVKVSYDGTAYSGFQVQPRERTVQEEIEKAIYMLTGETVKIIASGRTDAGVHARGQIFNFLTASPIETKRWCLALNSRLPKDIVTLGACEMPLDFHARRAAKQKTYHYMINNHRYVDVIQKNYQFHHPTALDADEMIKALPCLLGEHDYTSFCSRRSTKDSHVRTLYEARIEVEKPLYSLGPEQGRNLRIVITGSGFLYQMVRIIAGTLIHIGEGKINSYEMERILHSRDRMQAGPTAEACGLTLWEVRYDSMHL